MTFDLVDLDEATRQGMLAEIQHDVDAGTLYMGKYLSAFGVTRYEEILRAAIEGGDCETLVAALSNPGLFETHYMKSKPTGGYAAAKVPITAPVTLGEGEFNRFYLRGVCRRAIADTQVVEIYRARASSQPRAESEAMIGTRLDPEVLLADLRAHVGVDLALKLPPGPNSGLSGRLRPGA
jgi:hypothetical protein